MTKSALNSDLAASARAVAAEARAPDAEQLDFLAPVPVRIAAHEPGAIEANAAEERKRGRPKGAEGLSSRQLREMLVRAGGHPLIHLARWAVLTPEELAVRLQIKPVEAFDRLVMIWDKLAPYVSAKLAPTDDAGRAVVPIMMQVLQGAGAQATLSEALPPWARYAGLDADAIIEIEGNQALSEPLPDAAKPQEGSR